MRLTVRLESQPEGGFTAQCVEIPGAISQGETKNEAIENVTEAIRDILSLLREEAARQARNSPRTLQVVEVDA